MYDGGGHGEPAAGTTPAERVFVILDGKLVLAYVALTDQEMTCNLAATAAMLLLRIASQILGLVLDVPTLLIIVIVTKMTILPHAI